MDAILGKLKKMFSSQLGGGISWNMVSLAIMAVSGILYNLIIGAKYGKATVGLFNQAMAYYVAIAQLCVCGMHLSTLKYTSEFHDDEEKVSKIIGSSLVSTAIVSLLVSVFAYLVLKAIDIFIDDKIITYVLYVLPALFFFAINKIILNYLNGLSRMKEYAVFQSLRYIFIISAIIIFIIFKARGEYLVLCFLISEFLLLICMGVYAIKADYIKLKFDKAWFKEHLRYGLKIMPGNLVLELNANMDVMILGWFASDSVVGIYSFALKFAVGFYQLLVVVRRNINPLIARFMAKHDIDGLDEFKKGLVKYTKYLVPAFAVAITVGFAIISLLFGGEGKEYIAGIVPLIIVMVSITVNSTYIIFGNTLNQSGLPTSEARLNIATLMTNVILNLALIPFLGMYGAAIGTAVSYIVFSIILYYSIKSKLKYKLYII
jgi:O-antigen/teichoic acid export membrane protein